MEELLNWPGYIEDARQQTKAHHKLKDIVAIALPATLADADEWVKNERYARADQEYLGKYLERGRSKRESIIRRTKSTGCL